MPVQRGARQGPRSLFDDLDDPNSPFAASAFRSLLEDDPVFQEMFGSFVQKDVTARPRPAVVLDVKESPADGRAHDGGAVGHWRMTTSCRSPQRDRGRSPQSSDRDHRRRRPRAPRGTGVPAVIRVEGLSGEGRRDDRREGNRTGAQSLRAADRRPAQRRLRHPRVVDEQPRSRSRELTRRSARARSRSTSIRRRRDVARTRPSPTNRETATPGRPRSCDRCRNRTLAWAGSRCPGP